jgi:WD40 repeat protein
VSQLLEQAIATIKAGNKEKGHKLLKEVLQTEPRNELALLWMSSLADTEAQRAEYLKQVLAINPDNLPAKRGLAALEKKQSQAPEPTPSSEQVKPPPITSQLKGGSSLALKPPTESPTVAAPKTSTVQLTRPVVADETEDKGASLPLPPKTGMTDVFISYSRKDKPFVQKLYETLQQSGRAVWIDWGNIALSSNWRQEIREGIERAGSIIFVMSPDFLASKECRIEFDWAVELNKRLIPVVYRNVNPQDVPPELASLNWIFFRAEDDFEGSIQTLAETLDTDLDWVKAHTRLLMRAIEWDHHNRSDSFLLRGHDLDDAERRLAKTGKKPESTPLQGEYIFASRRSAIKRQRLMLGAVTVGLVVSILLAILAFTQYLEARRQTELARQQALHALSRQLAAQSVSYADDELDLALLLNLEAGRVARTVSSGDDVNILATLKYSPYLARFLHGHTDVVRVLVFSPDGKILASAGRDPRVLLWDVTTGQQIGVPLIQNSWVYALAFSPDGKVLASGGIDGQILLWDTATQQPLGPPLAGHTDQVLTLAFSPDGQTLASGGSDNTIRLWALSALAEADPATFQPPDQPFATLPAPVELLQFSPDGQTLVSGGDDNSLTFWNIAAGQPIASPHTGQFEGGWNTIAFSPDGKTVASGGDSNFVILWDLATGKPLGDPLSGHSAAAYILAFSPDGKTLASAGDDKKIILWDVSTGKPLGPPLSGHAGYIGSLAFSPDNRTLASGSADNDIILWDIGAGKILAKHDNWVYGVAFSPDSLTLASGSYDERIILWDLAARQAGTQPNDNILEGHQNPVRAVAYSPDGKILASGGEDKRVILWDTATHQPIGQPLSGHAARLKSVAFSPDGTKLVSGSADGAIILWDTATWQPIGQFPLLHTNELDSIAFSPDGKMLASGSDDKTIILWDTTTLQPLGAPLTGHQDWVNSVVFSPDGKILASGSADNTVILWDILTRQPLGPPLVGHTNRIWSVAFSPDGKILASGSADNTVILWNVATRHPAGPPLTGHVNLVRALAFSPDSHTLASGSADNSVILWNVNLEEWSSKACRIANRNLTQEEWNMFIGPEQPYQLTCPELPNPAALAQSSTGQ